MHLDKLDIQGLRNLNHVNLDLSPGVNLFWGGNGSGKTSVLEAIYILSRGRSFRTRNLRAAINHQAPVFTCFGLLSRPGSSSLPLGVSRERSGKMTFKVAGEQIRTASRLAENLPTQLFNSDSFLLLEGSPAYRRRFIDWGVFHVEQSYRDLWVRFQKCLKHRNSLLRHGRIDRLELSVWDREFARLSVLVTRCREEYLEGLLPLVDRTVRRLGLPGKISFSFNPGWDVNKPLEEVVLPESHERDRHFGRTHMGPHRSDLKVYWDGRPATDVMSRGQTKILVTALKMAQGFHYRHATGRQCLYLLDDLPAELDADYRKRVGEMLQELGGQVFITGVDKADLERSWPTPTRESFPTAVFHVEQGNISRQ